MFIKYGVFFENFKIFRTLSFLFFPSVSVYVHTRQVEHQGCSRTGRVQKNHKTSRKNTFLNEHPVCHTFGRFCIFCFFSSRTMMILRNTVEQVFRRRSVISRRLGKWSKFSVFSDSCPGWKAHDEKLKGSYFE